MKTVTSVSGGRTSAYLAANYPSDDLVFSLVRIEDESCRFKDEKVRQLVEDRIEAPFIATAEDDTIIYTMLDLEQYLGQQVTWVTGITFEEAIKLKGGWLPNKMNRYCTTELKMVPIFNWWKIRFSMDPVIMQIGYRAHEVSRANDMLSACNADGLSEFEGTVAQMIKSRRFKWATIPWRKPSFPLIEEGIYKQDIARFWKGKPVRFADYNNCHFCFNRNAYFLRYMYEQDPRKIRWAASQEGGENGYWKADVKYSDIIKMAKQGILFSDFEGCDDGYCEIA